MCRFLSFAEVLAKEQAAVNVAQAAGVISAAKIAPG
jgi:hypothetical protein